MRIPITRASPSFSRIDVTPYIPAVADIQSPKDDLGVAVAAVQAAFRAALGARSRPLNPRAKSVAADLVTEADAEAERAAARTIAEHRPQDGVLGEEGTNTTGSRRWVIDAIDGTVAFASGLPGWCSAVALEDGHGIPAVAAVLDAANGELHTAQRGRPLRTIGPARPLSEAHVAAFFRQDRLVLPGVRENAHRLLDAAGLIRHAGPGTLELAWVAAGRLDAWIQPVTDPWDWLPGALLVIEAGGVARTIQTGVRWHIAGPSTLVDELARLLR
jgi:myo-inositol-1(or 4)-monophosphatase